MKKLIIELSGIEIRNDDLIFIDVNGRRVDGYWLRQQSEDVRNQFRFDKDKTLYWLQSQIMDYLETQSGRNKLEIKVKPASHHEVVSPPPSSYQIATGKVAGHPLP